MKTITINVPFACRIQTDMNGFYYCEDSRVSVSGYAAQEAKAKRILKAEIAEQVSAALENQVHSKRHAIGTACGVVLVVHFDRQWIYHITGPDRAFAGSTICNSWKQPHDCIEAARKHADQSYGGVVWESCF